MSSRPPEHGGRFVFGFPEFAVRDFSVAARRFPRPGKKPPPAGSRGRQNIPATPSRICRDTRSRAGFSRSVRIIIARFQ